MYYNLTTIVFWLVKQFSSHSWWWKKDGKDTVSYSTIILLIVILVIVVLLLNVLQPNYYCFLIGQTVFQPQLVVEKRWQRYCIIQYYYYYTTHCVEMSWRRHDGVKTVLSKSHTLVLLLVTWPWAFFHSCQATNAAGTFNRFILHRKTNACQNH